jgi:signal transduction histidine kinase
METTGTPIAELIKKAQNISANLPVLNELPDSVSEIIQSLSALSTNDFCPDNGTISRNYVNDLIEPRQEFIWAVNHEFELTMANKAYFRFYETRYATSLKIGGSVLEINDKIHGDFWKKEYEKVIRQKQSTFELQFSGCKEVMAFRVHLSAIMDKGKVLGISGIGYDISDQKKLQKALALRERYLDAIVNIQWYMLILEDKEYYLKRILRLLGEVSGADRVYYFENTTTANKQVTTNLITEWVSIGIDPIFNNERFHHFDFKAKLPRWFDFLSKEKVVKGITSHFPLTEQGFLDPMGSLYTLALPLVVNSRFFGFIGFDNCHDTDEWQVTEINLLRSAAASISLFEERRFAETKIRRSEEIFRSIIVQTPDGIILVDKEGRIVEWNKGQETITGLTKQEVYNKYIWDVFDMMVPQYVKAANAFYSSYIKTETISMLQNTQSTSFYKQFESEIVTTTNKFRYLQSVAFPILLDEGYLIGFFSRDITLRKQEEEQIRQSERQMRELNDMKNRLFSIIAHDLRNPIGNLKQGLMMLFDKAIGQEVKDEIAQELTHEAQNIFELLENLLYWARGQQNELIFSPINTDLVKIFDETLDLLGFHANRKCIRIVKKLPATLWVTADRNMISSVVRNLISNAIKFTFEFGEIILSAIERESEWEISVADNGMGISEENQRKLFRTNPVATYGTNREKGSGLGLTICKDFVEKNGGKINVVSKIGEGSTFTFTLPRMVQ